MFLAIAQCLPPAALQSVRAALPSLVWRDGGATAGPAAVVVKRNEQADLASRSGAALRAGIETALWGNPTFAAVARPRRISPLIVSRTGPDGGYGAHTDNAVMGTGDDRMRADVAFTLFLSDPDDYSGGELVIDDPLADRMVKLSAGDMLVYPATTIHRVADVTRGERIVCVGWAESLVPDAQHREVLWDLERSVAALPPGTDPAVRLTLVKAIGNLLRMWVR